METIWIIGLLTVVALGLIAVDFFLPGFVLASIGIVLMLTAVSLAYHDYGTTKAAVLFLAEVALGVGTGYSAIRYGPNTAAGKKMILAHEQTGQRAGATHAPELVGAEGTALTVLRPAGMGVFAGKRLDVIAESGMIEPNSAIKVVAIDGSRIVVRKF